MATGSGAAALKRRFPLPQKWGKEPGDEGPIRRRRESGEGRRGGEMCWILGSRPAPRRAKLNEAPHPRRRRRSPRRKRPSIIFTAGCSSSLRLLPCGRVSTGLATVGASSAASQSSTLAPFGIVETATVGASRSKPSPGVTPGDGFATVGTSRAVASARGSAWTSAARSRGAGGVLFGAERDAAGRQQPQRPHARRQRRRRGRVQGRLDALRPLRRR